MKRKQKTKICLSMVISLLTALIVLCSCSLNLSNIEDIVSVTQENTLSVKSGEHSIEKAA